MADGLKQYLGKISTGEKLTQAEAHAAFSVMMGGDATMSQMGAFLMALRLRGENADEIAGAAMAMRERMVPLDAPKDAMDIVGTGGDRSGTYNISTTAAFVVAGCGVKIAKHGNRAASSKSGSADVLTALGFNLDAPMGAISQSIYEAGFGFMLAQRHHGAVRNVMPTRVELGIPTIFNFLGPLCNPAGVKRALIGCFDRNYLSKLAETLKLLQMDNAFILNGDAEFDKNGKPSSSLDEVSLSGETHIFHLHNGLIDQLITTPEMGGLARKSNPEVLGGNASENAEALINILKGAKNDYRDIVLLNAGAALIVAQKVKTLKAGVTMASESIDSGAALNVLEKARNITPLL